MSEDPDDLARRWRIANLPLDEWRKQRRKLSSEEWGTILAIAFLFLMWIALGPLGHIWPESDPELRDDYVESPR